MQQKPKIIKQQTICKSQIFNIQAMDLKFSNGEERRYERLVPKNSGAVLIVPMLDVSTVLLIKEYAAGLDKYELGLPKGLIESGEEILDAANRELMEEVGYGAKKLTYINEVTLAPGYMSHSTHIVLAEDLYEKRLPGDEPEAIEVVPYPMENFTQLLQEPDFTEARSIAALFMAREQLVK